MLEKFGIKTYKMDPNDSDYDDEFDYEYRSYDDEINPYILESLMYEHLMEEYFQITNIIYE